MGKSRKRSASAKAAWKTRRQKYGKNGMRDKASKKPTPRCKSERKQPTL